MRLAFDVIRFIQLVQWFLLCSVDMVTGLGTVKLAMVSHGAMNCRTITKRRVSSYSGQVSVKWIDLLPFASDDSFMVRIL